MKSPKFINFFLLVLTGCSAINTSPKEERAKMEMSLRKMRTDLDEIKHDLNSNQMELHILEGKVLTQDTSLTSLKEQTLESQQTKLKKATELLTQIDKKIKGLEKKFEEALADIRKLTIHANETTTALTQYQDKINEQNHKLQDISKIKTTIKELLKSNSQTFTYTVKSGDTLDTIAKTYGTSIEILKRLNKISDDTIYADQEILIPTSY